MHRHGWIEIASADDDMNAAAVLRSISFNDLPASTGAGRVSTALKRSARIRFRSIAAAAEKMTASSGGMRAQVVLTARALRLEQRERRLAAYSHTPIQ
jgi:hypothetical protein